MKFLFCFLACLFLAHNMEFAQQKAKSVVVNINIQKMTQPKSRAYAKMKKLAKTKCTMIIYVDEMDCPSCFVSHLYEWEIFMKECEENNVSLNFKFIFSPPQKDRQLFLNKLSSSSISHLSYIDVKNVFRNSNPWLIKDTSRHVFIVDENRHPVFIGNPPYDQKIMTWLMGI